MSELDFVHYLAGKKTVDDRALNRDVHAALVRALPPQTLAAPLRALEIGAGIGTMIERLVSWGTLHHAHYTAIDAQPENIAALNDRLPLWAADQGLKVTARPIAGAARAETCLEDDHRSLTIAARVVDLFDLIADAGGQEEWDLLIAHAILDLLDLPRALPQILPLVRPGGALYLTLNFDGATLLEPALDPTFDDEIERLYHQTMDDRITNGHPSGDSRAGRHLFSLLRANGAEVVAAGASDWVVFAGPQGYPADEADFLHRIVETMCEALQSHPALAARRDRFLDWIARRHAQIENGTLVYTAHQLDFLARR